MNKINREYIYSDVKHCSGRVALAIATSAAGVVRCHKVEFDEEKFGGEAECEAQGGGVLVVKRQTKIICPHKNTSFRALSITKLIIS